ncbi:MAG TPA: RNA polymerase sigma factor [Polyangiaceae bacterium]|nr:RNA polymerase sigma factor [Polyangiaceae bacterium]
MHVLDPALFQYFAVPVRARTASPIRLDPGLADGELVRRARRGDRWAEEALYHRHVRDVTRVALRLLSRSADAEDVVQDAFVLALRDLAQLEDGDAFRSWLLKITVHQAHRKFRRRKLLRALGLDRGEDDAALPLQVDPRAGPEVHVALGEVERLLTTLPARSRIAWVLRHVEAYSIDEVARACNCSRATTKRALVEASRVLAEYVAHDDRWDDDQG